MFGPPNLIDGFIGWQDTGRESWAAQYEVCFSTLFALLWHNLCFRKYTQLRCYIPSRVDACQREHLTSWQSKQYNVIFMFNELRMMPVYCLPTWFADLKYEIFDTSTMPSDTVSCSTWPFARVKVHKLWCENPNSMLCMIPALVFKY